MASYPNTPGGTPYPQAAPSTYVALPKGYQTPTKAQYAVPPGYPSAFPVRPGAGAGGAGAAPAKGAGVASRLSAAGRDWRNWIGGAQLLASSGKEQECSVAYVAGFRQFKYLAGFLLRFPFHYRVLKDGRFEFYWQKSQGVIFSITSIVIFIISVVYTVNLFGLILNFPPQNAAEGIGGGNKFNARAEEVYIFYRNSAMGVIYGMLLLHVCVANWRTFRKRKYIATYFTFCANSLDLMQVNAADGLAKFNFFLNAGFLAFVVVIIGMMIMRVSPITSGGPGFVGILFVRTAYPPVHTNRILYLTLRGFSQAFMIYLLLAAKLYVMLFIFQCKVIEGAFHLWNQRLDTVLNRGDDFLILENRTGRRTNFRELFEDHTILLDLIDGADTLFAETIESYYACQVLSMIFEMYWFWRSLAGDEFNDVRKLDAIFIFIYLLHSLVFMLMSSFAAASVAEEAMDGLEVLRRKGMFGRKSAEELYFLMSLYVSYSGHYDIAISGGGFSNIDRGFLVAIGGTILSYFIVLIQFSHPLALDADDPLRLLILEEGRLLRSVEDTQILSSRYDVEVVEPLVMSQIQQPTLFNLTQLG